MQAPFIEIPTHECPHSTAPDLLVEWAVDWPAQVEVVISHDDCALAGKSAVGRRGIAGSILVLKAS